MADSLPPRTLNDWLDHLETIHPKSIDLGLARVAEVAKRLHLTPSAIPTITVAGTNGKGSCVATLVALLRQSGARVGAYTSPHLLRFNERIAIDGEPVDDRAIVEAFTAIETARSEISLSYFEFATLAALWLFRRAEVDWQVLEVGLGGRLDAVNIVDANACVVTSIGLDHTDWLGPTRDHIAPEKAGVARAGCPAVVAETDLPSTLLPALESLGARVLCREREWRLDGSDLRLPSGRSVFLPEVTGLQLGNVAAAVVVLEAVGIELSDEALTVALSTLSVPGRQTRLRYAERDYWFDVAHNRESVAALTRALMADRPHGRCHAIFAAMADKPLRDMIREIRDQVDVWHLPAAPGVVRAADPADIATLLEGADVHCYPDALAAWQAALESSVPDDRIVVFGSFVTVGAQLEQWQAAQSISRAGD